MSQEELVLENSYLTEDMDLDNCRLTIRNCTLAMKEICARKAYLEIHNSFIEVPNLYLENIKGKIVNSSLRFNSSQESPALELRKCKLEIKDSSLSLSSYDPQITFIKVISSHLGIKNSTIISDNLPLFNLTLLDAIDSSVHIHNVTAFFPSPLTLYPIMAIKSKVTLSSFYIKTDEHVVIGKNRSQDAEIDCLLFVNERKHDCLEEGVQEIKGDNISYFNYFSFPVENKYVRVDTSCAPVILELPCQGEVYIENKHKGWVIFKTGDKERKSKKKDIYLKYVEGKWKEEKRH